MRASTRTATGVHALTFLAQWRSDGVQSSARIAESLNSNPVLVRRILGSLAKAGIVYALEGSGGGWQLTRPAEEITLLDAYSALEGGETLLPAQAHAPNSACVVGRGITSVLECEFSAAEEALEARLAQTSIADVLARLPRVGDSTATA